MNNATLIARISAAHRSFNGSATAELCKLANRRIKGMSGKDDARSLRDTYFLNIATARAGYPA